MENRRQFLGVFATALGSWFGGCSRNIDTDRIIDNDPSSNPSMNTRSNSAGKDAEPTPGDPSAEPPSNEDKVDVTLPGEPARIRNGQLPVYNAEKIADSNANGLANGLGDGEKHVRVGSDRTDISFAPRHSGSGRASGYATGTYQTAWTAPEDGKYQLRATFNRSGEFLYNLPPTGEVMTSLDVNAQIINYDTSTVVANQKFPQSLQSSNPRASSAVGEFLIETAVTALLGYSLGLSLVARLVLSQIVSELVELNEPGARGSRYDVATGVNRAQTPLNIGGPFEVTKGTTAIFEISPMLSWSYQLNDFHMNPQFRGDFDFQGFWVEKLD